MRAKPYMVGSVVLRPLEITDLSFDIGMTFLEIIDLSFDIGMTFLGNY